MTQAQKRRGKKDPIRQKPGATSRLRLPSHILKLTRRSLDLASLCKKDFGRVGGTLIHNGIVVSCITQKKNQSAQSFKSRLHKEQKPAKDSDSGKTKQESDTTADRLESSNVTQAFATECSFRKVDLQGL